MNPTDPRTEIFRSSWSLYDMIIDANYMFHREIHAAVRNAIATHPSREGYALLDLGCGNTRGLAATLREFRPSRYLGVDMSRPALDDAASELAGLAGVELREEEMLKCVEELTAQAQTFDIVYSSFALHHLTAEDKARLFHAVAALLPPHGAFLLVDIAREADESREQYLEGYLQMVDSEWCALDAGEKQQVANHITAHDFPETLAGLSAMAQDAGLAGCRLLTRQRQHYVLLFSRLS